MVASASGSLGRPSGTGSPQVRPTRQTRLVHGSWAETDNGPAADPAAPAPNP